MRLHLHVCEAGARRDRPLIHLLRGMPWACVAGQHWLYARVLVAFQLGVYYHDFYNYVLLSSDNSSNKSKEAAKSCSVSRMNLELKWEILAEEQREAAVLPSAVRLLHRLLHLPGVPACGRKGGNNRLYAVF